MAKILISIGVVLIILGSLYYLFGNIFQWMGKLPGDIRIERENIRIYIPLMTGLVISILFTLIVWLIGFFTQK